MNFPSSRSDYFLNLSKTDEKIETNLYIGLSEIWRKGGIPQPNTIVVDVPEISFKGTTNRITYHILLEYFNPYADMYTSGLIFNVVDTFKCTQDVYLKTIALQMMLSEDGRLAGFTYDDGGVDEVFHQFADETIEWGFLVAFLSACIPYSNLLRMHRCFELHDIYGEALAYIHLIYDATLQNVEYVTTMLTLSQIYKSVFELPLSKNISFDTMVEQAQKIETASIGQIPHLFYIVSETCVYVTGYSRMRFDREIDFKGYRKIFNLHAEMKG